VGDDPAFAETLSLFESESGKPVHELSYGITTDSVACLERVLRGLWLKDESLSANRL